MSRPNRKRITDEELKQLRRLSEEASAPPWRSLIEGRDHVSGESFLLTGPDDSLDQDLYLNRESDIASVADHDFIAAARNYIDALLDEIELLREEMKRLRATET